MRNKRKIKLTVFSAIISVATLLLFHLPFFRHALKNVESGFNGTIIIASLSVLMLAVNFFATYLLLYLGRAVGKVLLGLSFVGDAITLYFINTYDVLVDDTMMGNVFNTNYSEATGYWGLSAFLYILLLGVLPCVIILLTRINYGSLKRFFANIGTALLIALGVGFGNMTNWPWIDNNAPVLGSLLMPWSYVVNAIRYKAAERERNREEIMLPDAVIANDEKEVMVLVIGESARRENFSLYGYSRNTNPELSQVENLKTYIADANATYTTAGVKAILDSQDSDKLYEILPNYLYRTGVDVTWRTTNWGESPLRVGRHEEGRDLSAESGISVEYDEVLLYKMKDIIEQTDKDKVLIVLHTSTSHGPTYNLKYPPEYEIFKPVSTSVEMSKVPRDQVLNAYDNSIVYTDHVLASIIDILKSLDGWKSCMLYVSDHGESLGENNLYMHGVPISLAPKEQIEIPFIVWSSDPSVKYRDIPKVDQHYVFHSALHFLGIDSPIYNPELDIFE